MNAGRQWSASTGGPPFNGHGRPSRRRRLSSVSSGRSTTVPPLSTSRGRRKPSPLVMPLPGSLCLPPPPCPCSSAPPTPLVAASVPVPHSCHANPQEQRVGLLREMNQMKIDLQKCEDGLLFELSNAKGDILENVVLIENLENTKKTAKQINMSMTEAKATTVSIATSRKVCLYPGRLDPEHPASPPQSPS